MNNQDFSEEFVDLLILRSTVGLSESEQLEFEQLATDPEYLKEAERFDLTAAAFEQALQFDEFEEMPREIQDLLLFSAGDMFGGDVESESVTPIEPKVELADRSRVGDGPSTREASRFRWREMTAIAVAAASLLLVVTGFNPFSETSDVASQLTTAQRLASLTTANPADLIDLEWTPVHDADASGKVVWSDSRQEGYMVFENIKANDPALEKYQLWIFDTDKAQKEPIDGGVFDISAAELEAGRVIVPIKPNLPISKAVQFAVTVEKPPGVVVSKREKIPVLAAVE
ncbi:MAG: anti-sigma factor [Mariniblastus sp.]|nr:anti-sigma factor [Mariniblastus sp.]